MAHRPDTTVGPFSLVGYGLQVWDNGWTEPATEFGAMLFHWKWPLVARRQCQHSTACSQAATAVAVTTCPITTCSFAPCITTAYPGII